MSGRKPKLSYNIDLELRDGVAAYWLVTLPVLDRDHQPVPGALRDRRRLPADLSKREAEALARQLYRELWERAGEAPAAAAQMHLVSGTFKRVVSNW